MSTITMSRCTYMLEDKLFSVKGNLCIHLSGCGIFAINFTVVKKMMLDFQFGYYTNGRARCSAQLSV